MQHRPVALQNFCTYPAIYGWVALSQRASPKAAAAAAPPIITVCNALRNQPVPTSRPFTAPKTAKRDQG